ncbi:type II secretion system protein GspL [Sulfuricaulis limicola]|uniref:type II secretion system protein GspL n=1 Tax=Sulfuricaulis limicola TaxID=1620215 RepID=UPI001556B89D|nr:type II secretion system protein GspL [Sulfuricaulis limicola]
MRQSLASQGGDLELLLPRGWPENRGKIRWRLRRGPGAAPHGEVTELNQIPGVGAMTRVLVWTPPSDSLLTRVTLPTRSRAKIQQALPFALEDQLIGEPEHLHFAYRILEGNNLAVAVTARERMQAWISHLTDAGLRPTGFCPAILALPLDAGSWTVTFHENDMWVRTGMASGFSCAAGASTPPAMLELALREAREKQDAPVGLTVIHPPAGFDQAAWAQLKLPLSLQKQDFWAGYHEPLPALNLLQGGFAPSHQMQEMLPGLRPAAIMLAIWLIGSLAFSAWEWWQLNREHQNLKQDMTQVFRQTFPDAKVVVDPALQMQRLLSELQGKSGKSSQADALPLLGHFAPVMQSHPQIKLRGIQYDESRLTADLSLPDFQAMETLKNALIARGLQVEVVGANTTPAGIEGRLRLSQGGKAGG